MLKNTRICGEFFPFWDVAVDVRSALGLWRTHSSSVNFFFHHLLFPTSSWLYSSVSSVHSSWWPPHSCSIWKSGLTRKGHMKYWFSFSKFWGLLSHLLTKSYYCWWTTKAWTQRLVTKSLLVFTSNYFEVSNQKLASSNNFTLILLYPLKFVFCVSPTQNRTTISSSIVPFRGFFRRKSSIWSILVDCPYWRTFARFSMESLPFTFQTAKALKLMSLRLIMVHLERKKSETLSWQLCRYLFYLELFFVSSGFLG